MRVCCVRACGWVGVRLRVCVVVVVVVMVVVVVGVGLTPIRPLLLFKAGVTIPPGRALEVTKPPGDAHSVTAEA